MLPVLQSKALLYGNQKNNLRWNLPKSKTQMRRSVDESVRQVESGIWKGKAKIRSDHDSVIGIGLVLPNPCISKLRMGKLEWISEIA